MTGLARRVTRSIAFLATMLLFIGCENNEPESRSTAAVDILFSGGSVYSGAPGDLLKTIDVGVIGGEIVFVGDAIAENVAAKTVLDASGMIVAPGFIDPHTHSLDDLRSDDRKANLNYVMQGVTTVFNGNDGGGPAVYDEILEDLRTAGIGTNTAFLIGHGSVRRKVMDGDDRPPTPDEMEQMSVLVRNAMESGALGLSTGLYYVPGSFAETDEVVALAKIAAEYSGVYDTHLRDESTYNIGLLAAIEEALEVGRGANIPVHISHIKALGVDVWGYSSAAIELIESAQAAGQEVTANQYPWRASGTHLRNTLLPRSVLSGPRDLYLQRLKQPDIVNDIRAEMLENLRRRGGSESLLVVVASDPSIMGLTLAEIARQREQDPLDTAIEIMLEGPTRVASFNMSPNDIEAFVQKKWVMTSSDGTDGHPRKYASFPKKYQDYVVKQNLMTVEEFLYSSSGLTADTFGLKDRGRIERGYVADIIVFDPTKYAPIADFKTWNRLSVGVVHSIINGKLLVLGGEYTGELPGLVLRSGDEPSTAD